MGLDLWFRADVARILQATNEAMCSTAAVMGAGLSDDVEGRERAAGYRQGFGAALRAVAAGFGLTESAPGGLPDWWRPAGVPELMPFSVEIDAEPAGMVGRETRARRFLTGSD